MRRLLIVTALFLASCFPAVAQNNQGQNNNNQGQNQGNGYRGAPAPIIGAGLPVLAIGIGYGVYWLVRRRRRPAR
jgi:hypothetical protein